MSNKAHKRKRSIDETPVNLSKMQMAVKAFESLKEELEGIEEAEGMMEGVKEHLEALGNILVNAKKPKLSFSTVTAKDLTDLGVIDAPMDFDEQVIIDSLEESMKDDRFRVVRDALSEDIKDIYEHVNMSYEAGARMILYAVLRALWKITDQLQTANEKAKVVTVLPEFKLPGDGIQVVNPSTGREMWLTGSTDYCITRYPNVGQMKSFMLGLSSSIGENILRVRLEATKEQVFLIEAKCAEKQTLLDNIPEAVSQALALSQFLGLEEMRFVLADGISWIFCILHKQEDKTTYYQPVAQMLLKTAIAETAPRILLLMREWLCPSEGAKALCPQL